MPRLSTSVASVREKLGEGREKLKRRHQNGASGTQICQQATDLLDAAVRELFDGAIADLGGANGKLRSSVALVTHGGYGRREVAPFSDVDLMVLYPAGGERHVRPLAERLVRDVFDTGLQLGQSVRTAAQACRLARGDPQIFTSLSESRWLAGDRGLFDEFMRKFHAAAHRRRRRQIKAIERARHSERVQYGETVYLLEPNVKRSRGGLRDVQLLRWIGFAAHGTGDPDQLRRSGALSAEDCRALLDANEFLLQLRNEMHFHAGKAHDLLDRAEQVRLAEVAGYQGRKGLLPVEQFMQEYFDRTNAVSRVVTRFLATCRRPPRVARVVGSWLSLSHQVEGDFRVGANITTTKQGRAKLGELSEILRLTDLANRYDRPIADETLEAIRAAARDMPPRIDDDAAGRFLSLLQHPLRLGEQLRVLHEATVLEHIVPGFAHARSLLQFNEYHKYTVDEHCLRAVERATEFRRDRGPLGNAYRGIKKKHLLHLALLIHDLGKGYAEDHSEVGRRLAQETAQRLRLSPGDTETLEFLVHKHLLMSHLAFRRDTSDERLLLEFVGQVGSPEVLQMLYVLTCADFAAVGPEVFNDWKRDVLTDLYRRAMRHLDASYKTMTTAQRLRQLREEVWEKLGSVVDRPWFAKQIEAMPAAYFDARSAEAIAGELTALHRLPSDEVLVQGHYIRDNDTLEYTVSTNEKITPGVFHKLTGALTSQGLEILSAEINTLARGLIVDRFVVQDNDFEGEPPPERLSAVSEALRDALVSASDRPPTFRRLWRTRQGRRTAELAPPPTRVVVDNNTSEGYTILDVIATDRTGLLYTIARTLFDLGLSVSVAKIGTYLDQVVDVFYVTDQAGNKIEDEARLAAIRSTLVESIEAFEREDADST